MLEKLTRLMLSYLKVKISGVQKNRFLNIAIKNKICFWDYKLENGDYILCVKIKDFKKMFNLRKKCKVKISIIQKYGLKFRFKKIRTGLILGVFLAIFLYGFLYSKYWIINVSGNTYYPKEEILQIVNNNGIDIGLKRYVDDFKGENLASESLYKIENEIMRKIPEVSWVSINTNACSVDVAIKIGEMKPKIENKTGNGNMIAEKAGIVREVEAVEGMPEVIDGSVVNRGDVLITGVWDTNRGKFDWDKQENPIEFKVRADGKVMAEVPRTFTVSLNKEKVEYVEQETYQKYIFGLMFFEVPFTFSLVPDGEYKLIETKNYVNLFGKKLPIYFKAQELIKLKKIEKTYTSEELESELQRLLSVKISQELDFGEKIVEKVKFEIKEEKDCFTAVLECVSYENIAIYCDIYE